MIELALLLAIVYTPPGQHLFATAPLPIEVWFLALPFAALLFVLEEARKAVVRRRAKVGVGRTAPS